MTSGRRPALLAGVLASLRGVADSIVVAVEEPSAEAVHAGVADIADTVLAFPPTAPADRPIAWLFGRCTGTWIFNIDDDEVPSPALVAALPELVRREDITHAWVARRWLHPTPQTYLASYPWGAEFQLRLVLADPRFLQFSDVFHRPVVCHGPSTYVDAPLWHLDTVLNPAASRRRKAAAYEEERPGMRLQGVAHNTGLYVPELRADLELRPVPGADREAIEATLAFPPAPAGASRAALVHASHAELDATWVGPPYAESLGAATLTVAAAPAAMVAGAQHTVDVHVTNESPVTWRWGADARPAIRLGYRWRREGAPVAEPADLRTTFPADLPPGAAQLVPVHVVAPAEPGRYELELELVHDSVRRFGSGVRMPVSVRHRERIALVGRPGQVPELLARLGVGPEVEPVVVLRDPGDREAYGDYESVAGPRSELLRGTETTGRTMTLARLLWRTSRLAGRSRTLTASTERLVVGGPSWDADAAFGREWWALASTALAWRLGGRRVEIPDEAMPAGRDARSTAVRWVLRRLRS